MAAAFERALAPGRTARQFAPRARNGDPVEFDNSTRIARATALAKGANVTLAVRNASGTFAATAHDCKRVAKEGDSAWLRFGLQPGTLDAASDPSTLLNHTVLLWCDAALPPERDRIDAFPHFAVFSRSITVTVTRRCPRCARRSRSDAEGGNAQPRRRLPRFVCEPALAGGCGPGAGLVSKRSHTVVSGADAP